MPGYQKFKMFFRKALKPVTIMFISHGNPKRSFNLKMPIIGFLLSGICCFVVVFYPLYMLPYAIKYLVMEKHFLDYSKKIAELNTTLLSLKRAEKDFHKLLSLGSRDEILEKVETPDVGTFDVDQVQEQIESSMQTVGAIKDYLRLQKDIYIATPRGLPVQGEISCPYGRRINPITGHSEFHRGIDISADGGSPIMATADGIIVFSGWNGGGGNVVVIAHGHGYSTYYAHNKMNTAQVGQKVRRGEVVGYVGSTGSSTGSHVHYEIWHEGRSENPSRYAGGKS